MMSKSVSKNQASILNNTQANTLSPLLNKQTGNFSHKNKRFFYYKIPQSNTSSFDPETKPVVSSTKKHFSITSEERQPSVQIKMQKTIMNCSWESKFCKAQLPNITQSLKNNMIDNARFSFRKNNIFMVWRMPLYL